MKTYQPKQKEVKRSWHLLDAKDEVLGRLATKVAGLLIGKGKTSFSTHMDVGDFVVVINSEKVILTGKKASQKVYRSHSGYPGGLKEVTIEKMLKEHPERVLSHAVNGMVPKNRLSRIRLARLKVVIGDKNPYEEKFKEK